MFWRRKKIGLALGGGGARGMAHIGVFRAFEEEQIPIDMIVGTSIGALVGAAFASGMNSLEIEKKVDAFLSTPEFKDSSLRSIKELQQHKKLGLTQKIQAFFKNQYVMAQAMFRAGMLSCDDFQAMIDFFLPDIRIEECAVPFRAVATDLVAGREVVLSYGPLRKAVMASCAVPAAVPPIEMEGRILSDGGVIHLVPVSVARKEGAEFVVAVSVNAEVRSDEDFCTAMDIYVRATEIMSYHLEQCRLREADVVIHPEVGHLHWTDFPLAKDLIAEGRKAAKTKIHEIKKAFPLLRRMKLFSR